MTDKTDNIIPLKHLVIMPDGDRRWAKAKGLPLWEGHRRGAQNIQSLLEACQELKIPYLSMWGFSTENWKRSPEEVEQLMNLFRDFIIKKRNDIIKNKINFRHIGRKDRLSPDLLQGLEQLEKDTANFTEWHYIVGLDYGGQDEIVRATQKIIAEVQLGKLDVSALTPDIFETYLDTNGIPNPDFIIRTSGEQRTSGFMAYQSGYAELLFLPINFPDLTKEKLKEVIAEYYNRQRRFGAG
ncbi:di-trans,poly-cis-decaprenylcistransferase [Candidatus Dojkabacteria bacterium CG_4_9_14_3_um_filter_150_Dojkabacteria_WS6_41_13]|uniref:Isoprenyl transferase n=1 Tax=Candidatus Dojkabacteria bacterium CG_4_10_14_0_2_um_filter_Dojkabacteria_WS6_41_15 TaxID=2014249 RepID=A0A2M7W0K9_9BACT|nr:MAG: di-trans,poly-cis-decaprenylcistransferase [Candidatus Dojkabacteria bacterium CG_4_10_14_3_um_filter_Dojkabacteria_WS6_41_9]PJA12167.1 MAG: di-trans,poly-cis-decaprenylcistransferase [Candidatus Dojkabacteria bacterium CG_4_10_14_0_2_um_filter_Dojkabacteria_WS6_41_15]PJB23309.1 MAG: di-trans,poly-cis-decaprenylcistransferase [Candidatus Dojkabacteria bacterium CG_4_9_14_3_um_filter_150_Dojkabacteria_WS6_41_13]